MKHLIIQTNEERGRMEKICIVKLRKMTPDPDVSIEEYRPAKYAIGNHALENLSTVNTEKGIIRNDATEKFASYNISEESDHNISLTLTQEQIRRLKSDPTMLHYLNGDFAGEFERRGHSEESNPIVIKFEFEQLMPSRLLKSQEVLQMLRISKSCLYKMVSKGELQSYKIGRLRRFKLDDVLSYLENNHDIHRKRQNDSKFKKSHRVY
jgi:excisionase family DNA binding protein